MHAECPTPIGAARKKRYAVNHVVCSCNGVNDVVCRSGASWAASCTSTSPRTARRSRLRPCLLRTEQLSDPCGVCTRSWLELTGSAPGIERISQLHLVAVSSTSTSPRMVRRSRLRATPTPYTLYPTPFTLHLKPFALHLHPTPYTLSFLWPTSPMHASLIFFADGDPYRGTSLIRNRHPPQGHHKALGIVLL